MKFIDRLLIFLAVGCSLSSCGYQLTHQMSGGEKRTVSVPYIRGDHTAVLTTSLINEINRSNLWRYSDLNPDYVLHVVLKDEKDENVGFRYDLDKQGNRTSTLIPTETRLSYLAKVWVLDACTGECVLPVSCVSASIDFDHDWYTSRDEINVFSLGQLTDIEAATTAAKNPLSQRLSQRIVDYLSNLSVRQLRND